MKREASSSVGFAFEQRMSALEKNIKQIENEVSDLKKLVEKLNFQIKDLDDRTLGQMRFN